MPFIKKPKELIWTSHSKNKMAFYRLSESRVKRVINFPKRIEEGIAENTVALMQPSAVKSKQNSPVGVGKRIESWTQEIWVMVQDTKEKRKIISAWRYPGMTKPGDPLPEEILNELIFD